MARKRKKILHEEHIRYWCRYFSERSDILYRDTPGRFKSGADPVDGERYRLMAAALRKVLLGETVEDAVAWFRGEYKAFQAVNNAKVNAAPKMKLGPMSGQSCIHYRWASDCAGEAAEGQLLRVCSGLV